ncbi:MAG: glycoside hydrolase family 99-like domain-containing protein [Saccharofermentanales bacterium]
MQQIKRKPDRRQVLAGCILLSAVLLSSAVFLAVKNNIPGSDITSTGLSSGDTGSGSVPGSSDGQGLSGAQSGNSGTPANPGSGLSGSGGLSGSSWLSDGASGVSGGNGSEGYTSGTDSGSQEIAEEIIETGTNNPDGEKRLGFIGALSTTGHVNLFSPPITKDPSKRNLSNIEAGYLIEEMFVTWLRDTGLTLSGWDIDAGGGGISKHSSGGICLADDSKLKNVGMSRSFVPQTGGVITTELRIAFGSMADGYSFEIADGTTAQIRIITQSGMICVADGDRLQEMTELTDNIELGVKIVSNLDLGTSRFYIDGILYAQNIHLLARSGRIDTVRYQTPDAAEGALLAGPILVYKGYAVNERCISAYSGLMPDDWKATAGLATGTSVIRTGGTDTADAYSISLRDDSAEERVSIRKIFNPLKENTILEYSFFAFPGKEGLVYEVLSGSGPIFTLTADKGQMTASDSSGLTKQLSAYRTNLWNTVRITYEYTADSVSVSLNYKQKLTGFYLGSQKNGITGIRFSTIAATKALVHLDDIAVRKNPPLPSDYVPEPVVNNNPDYLVGAQFFPLYRPGYHLGWDLVNGYEDRMPLLGFYDEGNPEVTDWEIKMMAEHGIDYVMHYWNRPQTAVNQPVKKAFMGEALADGYFGAQYSESLKFAISYAYGNLGSLEDFKINIMPYWIEYYLKDARYMTIDNRPVIAFLDYQQLSDNLGGMEKVRELLEYIRSQCRLLGFDDAYILCTFVPFDRLKIAEMDAAGFDYYYMYNWGQMEGANDVAQLYGHLGYRDTAGADNFLASPSLGWDPEPWGGGNMGRRLTSAEMGKLFSALKSRYMSAASSGSLVRKMVMLGNWNEIGEGHYFMPTKTYGYSYLEEILKAFGGTKTHSDITPTKSQKDRICVLYPQDRVGSRTAVQPPVFENADTLVKRWDFDTADGWTKGYFPTEQAAAVGGYFTLKAQAKSYRPSMISRDTLGIGITGAKYIRIRVKGRQEDITAHLLFKTGTMTQFNWAEGYTHLRLLRATDAYTDYIADVWKPALFNGTLNQMHLTFYSDSAIAVDFIEILE